jgi:hypothetical protein
MVSPFDMSKAEGTKVHATVGDRRFTIEHDAGVGFYLYVHEGDRCTHDYLQDSAGAAKEFALEQFGVSEDAWDDATPTI